jgi:uncharacterized SAM-binding protein YcdF (DUF218 family)
VSVVRSVLLGAVAALALASALVVDLFLSPPVSSDPTHTDAVVVLAGSPDDRLPTALRIAEEGPGVLVLSVPGGDLNRPAAALCDRRMDVRILCVTPTPGTTRGESRAVGRLVEEQGWTRITVVTSTYHVARAAVTINQCTDAEVRLAESRPSMSLGRWLEQVVHEIGGITQTLASPPC